MQRSRNSNKSAEGMGHLAIGCVCGGLANICGIGGVIVAAVLFLGWLFHTRTDNG